MKDDNIPTSYDMFVGYEMTVNNVIEDCKIKLEFLEERLNPDYGDVLLPKKDVAQRRNDIENCIRNHRKMISWLTELKELRKGRAEKALAESAALAVLGKVRTAFLQGALGCSSYTDPEKHKKVRALVQEIEQTLVDAEVLSSDDRLSKPIEKEDSYET